MWIRGFKEKWWKKVLGSLQQQPPLSRVDVGRRDPGVNVTKFRWGQTRGRLKLKHCELCLKARSVLKMAKQMSSFCGGGKAKSPLGQWCDAEERDLLLSHTQPHEFWRMCVWFVWWFFFFGRGFFFLMVKNKIDIAWSSCNVFFTFRWRTNRLGGGRWFYRLLPLGCFVAGRPVVNVAVIEVALSVSGPLRLQWESPGGSCWESGAWKEALFELRVLKMIVVHHASSRPVTLSCRRLLLDLLM